MYHHRYHHLDGGIFYISAGAHHHMTDCNLTNLTILPMMDIPEVDMVERLFVWRDRPHRFLTQKSLFEFFFFDAALRE